MVVSFSFSGFWNKCCCWKGGGEACYIRAHAGIFALNESPSLWESNNLHYSPEKMILLSLLSHRGAFPLRESEWAFRWPKWPVIIHQFIQRKRKSNCHHHHHQIKKKILNLGSLKITHFKNWKSASYVGGVGKESCGFFVGVWCMWLCGVYCLLFYGIFCFVLCYISDSF